MVKVGSFWQGRFHGQVIRVTAVVSNLIVEGIQVRRVDGTDSTDTNVYVYNLDYYSPIDFEVLNDSK